MGKEIYPLQWPLWKKYPSPWSGAFCWCWHSSLLSDCWRDIQATQKQAQRQGGRLGVLVCSAERLSKDDCG